jgi:tRNA(fMet)-specific endonuclease VapC
VKYVLDTNAVSALMKGDPSVIRNLSRVAKADVILPQPVIAEIAYGIQRLPRSRRREGLQERFDLVRGELPRASWSDEVSEAFGIIKAKLERRGERIEDFDAAIAAHALVTGAILVTANLQHMARISGLAIQDWSTEIEQP